MTVKEIVALASEFVGEKELAGKLRATDTVTYTTVEQEKINLLTRAFNLVNQEIASDYLPFLKKEEVNVEGNILSFSALSKAVINIYEVKNSFGKNLKFHVYSNYIEIDGKAKSVVYSYLPGDIALDGDVEMMNGLSARVYAYGIASEYLLIGGVSEDAEIWEERFKESLFVLSRKRGEHLMPKRGWF